ncbi:uncharacterized protein LOC143036067 [Oratosquilla oratoria]|uniref:uncharacterized protein LOC143036067 n=1 Tax=Oratosquilla oratoria TaxID=337810 RepID=UPI003F76B71C
MAENIDELIKAHERITDLIKEYQVEETIPEESGESGQLVPHSQSSSVSQEVQEFIQNLTSLQNAHSELCRVNQDILRGIAQKSCLSLIHPKYLGEKSEWCKKVQEHLLTICNNKDLLIYHLQQPFIGTFLVLHKSYHRDLQELIEGLSDLLTNSTHLMKVYEEYSQGGLLKSTDAHITSLVNSSRYLQENFKNIVNLQNAVSSFL